MRAKTSKYRGVSLYSKGKYWVARITQAGKSYFLGLYAREKMAARVYDKAAIAMFGKKAVTNEKLFPNGKAYITILRNTEGCK